MVCQEMSMRWLKGRWDRMSLIWEFLFLAVILGAAVSDWKTRRISNRYPLLLLAGGLLALVGQTEPDLTVSEAVVGAVVCGLPLLVAALLAKGSFGGGDIKLMAAAGVCLGPEKGLYALFFGLVFGGFFGLGLTVLKKRKKEEAIPLGPFLAAGIAAESFSFFFY